MIVLYCKDFMWIKFAIVKKQLQSQSYINSYNNNMDFNLINMYYNISGI